jgi:acyl-CoA thioesterase-1
MQAGYGRRALGAKALAGIGVLLAGQAAAAATPPAPPRGLAQAPARRPLRVPMLGDSITAGFGLARGDGPPAQLERRLREAGHDVRIPDAGVSGDTTAGGRARLDWTLADNPDGLILALGGNDGLRGIEPRVTRANLADMLDRLAARRIPALLAGMLAPPNLGAEYGAEFAAVFTSLADERPDLVFYPFLLDGVAADPALNLPDRIHPNAAGAAEIARRMAPFAARLVARIEAG